MPIEISCYFEVKQLFVAVLLSKLFMDKRILGLDPGLAILGFGAICYQSSSTCHTVPSSAPLAVQVVQPITLIDFGIIKTSAPLALGRH
jgi:crossover junction endodeoxyribonuclease RuvC